MLPLTFRLLRQSGQRTGMRTTASPFRRGTQHSIQSSESPELTHYVHLMLDLRGGPRVPPEAVAGPTRGMLRWNLTGPSCTDVRHGRIDTVPAFEDNGTPSAIPTQRQTPAKLNRTPRHWDTRRACRGGSRLALRVATRPYTASDGIQASKPSGTHLRGTDVIADF